MQAISKLEQPNSPQALSSKLPIYVIIKKVIEQMERGKESVKQMESLIHQRTRLGAEDDNDQGFLKALDHHSMVALDTYDSSLFMLRSCDVGEDFIRKRTLTRVEGHDDSLDDHFKSEESGEEIPKNPTTKDRRGCYKRRRTGESRVEEVMQLSDDGFGWRKYGQKAILNTEHPRNYYRCTHKHDQKCQATKQVQQISENPTKYRIIYNGNHTCNNILKTPIIIDGPEEQSSSVFLCFESNNPTAKQALDSSLFPTSAFQTAMVKQESSSIKEEMPYIPYDCHRLHNQYSSSSDNLSTSQDLTATPGLSSTLVSDHSDVISTAEIYSSAASLHVMEHDYYSYMMAESVNLDQVLSETDIY